MSQGRNTGVKALFGGSQKKPLMTKVSMRHLNEIVRERNQYSRDAMEAWQDFINLKGRMDTELSKVTKRNNFLNEELESWKQQFLKFQAFAEQLTKETQDLKVKIESHKRDNRRLTTQIDQHRDESARLNGRLNGTEKQRDDALEALVLQQEIAEELERERKRNKKELTQLQHTNSTISRQRDEAQRVVLHLRALIDGQAHHMEHIVKSLGNTPEISEYIDEEFNDDEDEHVSPTDQHSSRDRAEIGRISGVPGVSESQRAPSRTSTVDGKPLDGEDVSTDMETRLLNSPEARSRLARLSMTDVADRHLRDKTESIAYIIRNISEQCAAAVEGLQLAQRADSSGNNSPTSPSSSRRNSSKKPAHHRNHPSNTSASATASDAGDDHLSATLSESGQPSNSGRRPSSIPPTPDLIHNRSSTSMSIASMSTTPDNRYSGQAWRNEEVPDVPTRIVEGGRVGADDEVEEEEDVSAELDAGRKFAPGVVAAGGQGARTGA